MPAKSTKQRNLMAAALHGADFPKAQAARESMSTKQIKDFVQPVESESHAYNWRSRKNLKRGRG